VGLVEGFGLVDFVCKGEDVALLVWPRISEQGKGMFGKQGF